jgi:hypothetical protein
MGRSPTIKSEGTRSHTDLHHSAQRNQGYQCGELGGGTLPVFMALSISAEASAAVPANAPAAAPNIADVDLKIVLRNARRLVVAATVDPEMLAQLFPVVEGR